MAFGRGKFCCRSPAKVNNATLDPDCDGGKSENKFARFERNNFPGDLLPESSEKCCHPNDFIPCPRSSFCRDSVTSYLVCLKKFQNIENLKFQPLKLPLVSAVP